MAQVDNSSGVVVLRAGAKKCWTETIQALELAGLKPSTTDKVGTRVVRGRVLSLWDQYGLVYCRGLGLVLFHVQRCPPPLIIMTVRRSGRVKVRSPPPNEAE